MLAVDRGLPRAFYRGDGVAADRLKPGLQTKTQTKRLPQGALPDRARRVDAGHQVKDIQT